MFKAGNLIMCPNAISGQAPIQIDMTHIYETERRIGEIATVSPGTAPELLATFNKTWLQLDMIIKDLNLQYILAEKSSNKRRSVVILDEAPRILKEKGLVGTGRPSGSEDLRNAVLELDLEYQKCQDRVELIEATIDMLAGMQKGIEMAYNSVKKIIGDRSTMGGDLGNRNLSTNSIPNYLNCGQTDEESNG